MSGRSLNPSQEAVVRCRDHLCVIAGAGSGKTHTLVEAVTLRLAEAFESRSPDSPRPPLDITEILALTFTEKAAAELRSRLFENFRARQDQARSSGAAAEAEFWRSQAARLDRADIGTIHGYALSLVRENALALGLASSPVIEDEARLSGHDLQEVLTDWLHEEDRDLTALLETFSLSRLTALLTRCAGTVSSWGLTELSADDLERPEPELSGALRELADLARQSLGDLESGALKITPEQNYYPRILETLLALVRLLDRPESEAEAERTLAGAAALLEAGGDWRTKAGREARKALQGLVDELRGPLHERQASILKAHFLGLARRLPERLAERRRQREAINFDDILILARRLLATSPEIRRREILRRRLIFIDEFQDTNRLQTGILAYLLLPPEDGRVYEQGWDLWPRLPWADLAPRLSVFGDPKQSIYRFRGAEVELMSGLAQTLSRGQGRLLALEYNYRSQGPLPDFFNLLFPPLLGDFFGPLDLQRPVRAALAGAPHLVRLSGSGPAPKGVAAKALEQARLLVKYLGLICGPDSLIKIQDPEDGRPRKPRPGDVAVLFRRFTWAGLFRETLLEAGWPVRATGGGSPWDFAEVRALSAAFLYLSGQSRDLNLAAALRSPLGPVSDEALLRLAWPGGRLQRPRPLSQWFRSRPAPAWPEELDPDDRQALDELRDLLLSLEAVTGRMAPVEILERLAEERRLLPLARLEPDGPARIQAITRFLALTRTLGRGDGPWSPAEELLELRRHWDPRFKGGPELRGREEAVSLMTVHAAKGLEFPVVVLAEADRRPPALAEALLIDRQGRLALKFTDAFGASVQPRDYQERLAIERQADARENARLFYVAATRARDQLVFLGRPDPKKAEARLKRAQAGPEESPAENIWLEALLDNPRASATAKLVDYGPEDLESLPAWTGSPAEESEPVGEPRWLLPMKLEKQSLAVTDLARLLADPEAYYRESHLGLGRQRRRPDQKTFFDLEAAADDKPGQAGLLAGLFQADAQQPPEGAGNLKPNEAGTLFHAVLEELEPVGGDLTALLTRAAERLAFQPTAGEISYLTARLSGFLNSSLGRSWREARQAGRPHWRELPFRLELPSGGDPGRLRLTGIIDLFFVRADGVGQIVDYKLAAIHPGPELAAYEHQLCFYAQALVSAGWTAPLAAALYFAGGPAPGPHQVFLAKPQPLSPLWPKLEKIGPLLSALRPLRPGRPAPGPFNIKL